MARDGDRSGANRAVIVGASITAAATIIAAFITVLVSQGGTSEPYDPFSAGNSQPPSSEATSTSTSPPSSTPAPVSSTPPSTAPNAGTVYLDGLDTIEDELDAESVSWGTATFARSLVNPLSGCSAVGPVEWVRPAGADSLKAEIGVAVESVEADSKVTFNVYLDGVLKSENTLGVGQHTPIDVPLGDSLRITFESIIDQSRRGNCNTEAYAVWGNARLE